MIREYREGDQIREDLADQMNWYRLEKEVPESVIDGFLSAYDALIQKLLEWPHSGRTIDGGVVGLQEANLPPPYEHYVVLFIGDDEQVLGLRLFRAEVFRERIRKDFRRDLKP